MSTGYHVIRLHDARAVVLTIEKAPVSLLGGGWDTIERYVSAFRADHHLVAPDIVTRNQDANSFPNRAFRALAPIVDRCVQKVHSLLQSSDDCRYVAAIFDVIALAEVRAQSERLDHRPIG